MSIEILPGSSPDVMTIVAKVRDDYPDAQRGIVVVFDAEGGMHTYYSCNDQQMAMACVRLGYLAGRD